MQIEIYSPKQGEHVQPVQWNYQELKQWIETGLKSYENRVYTEETMQTAKKDRADLNRLSKAINDKRIEMKRMFLQPYEEFEQQAKELSGMIDAQSAEIDRQVKAWEQREKDEKQKAIMQIYRETIGDLVELIPYDRIHNPKWLNKGTSLKSIKEEIGTLVSRTHTAFTAINTMGFDEATTNRVKGAFLRRFELADAMAEKEAIETERRKLAEYELKKRAEENAKAEAEAREKEEAARRTAAETPDVAVKPDEVHTSTNLSPKAETTVYEPSAATLTEKVYLVDFRVTATRKQLNDLKQFMIVSGIKYGRVE